MAQGSSRAQTWDFSLGAIYQQGDSASGDGGSSLEVDDAWGLGLNIGYNFTDHLNLSADFDFLRPDFTAVVIAEPNPPDGSQTTTAVKQALAAGATYAEAGFADRWNNNVTDGFVEKP